MKKDLPAPFDTERSFVVIFLPQPDDLDDALGLIAGQLKVMLQRIGGGVPVVAQGGIQNFQMLHGQCVALGYLCAAYISWKRGLLTNEEFFEIRDMNVGFDLPIFLDALDENEVVLATKSDKKMEHGQIKFILLKSIGHAYVDFTVTDEEIRAAVHYFLDNGEEDGE